MLNKYIELTGPMIGMRWVFLCEIQWKSNKISFRISVRK